MFTGIVEELGRVRSLAAWAARSINAVSVDDATTARRSRDGRCSTVVELGDGTAPMRSSTSAHDSGDLAAGSAPRTAGKVARRPSAAIWLGHYRPDAQREPTDGSMGADLLMRPTKLRYVVHKGSITNDGIA
jgi:riboflavin synthase alpha subunit